MLAPMLFSMMFSAILANTFNEDEHGIKVNYCTAGKFFNLKRLQAKTKVEGVLVHSFLFADDCALNADSEAEMQRRVDRFFAPCANFGLTINTKKTGVPSARTTPFICGTTGYSKWKSSEYCG